MNINDDVTTLIYKKTPENYNCKFCLNFLIVILIIQIDN